MKVEIRLPWPSPPLSSNQRLHWARKADLTRTVRETTRLLGRGITPQRHVTVGLVWVVGDRRRRDADNVVPTLKACADGLVDAGVVPDDTPEFMSKTMPVIRYVKGATPRLLLTIEGDD